MMQSLEKTCEWEYILCIKSDQVPFKTLRNIFYYLFPTTNLDKAYKTKGRLRRFYDLIHFNDIEINRRPYVPRKPKP